MSDPSAPLFRSDRDRELSPLRRARRELARFLRRAGLRGAPKWPSEGAPAAPAARAKPLPTPKPAPQKSYSVPLDRQAAPFRAELRLSLPSAAAFPWRNAKFAEHALDPRTGEAGEVVIAMDEEIAVESRDFGRTWKAFKLPVELPADVCFTTAGGARLVATVAHAKPGAERPRALVYRFDAEWKLDGEPLETFWPWHGSASIGQSGDTLMFAEYPNNMVKYGLKDEDSLSLVERLICPSRVFRSRDDGRTWEVVFTVPADLIRHLHTLVPEPDRPGRWWLTSGDRAQEVHVWRSDDDGDSWIDVTADVVPARMHRSCTPRSVQRMTDVVFHDGWMIWGADDWLGSPSHLGEPDGPAVGSRLFRARVDGDGPIVPEEIGYCGPPIRNLVDVGPAFLVISEAKYKAAGLRPETFLLFKDELNRVHRFVQIDNYAARPTGFTYSRASRKARDGVLFSARSHRDVFAEAPRVLRWEVSFF